MKRNYKKSLITLVILLALAILIIVGFFVTNKFLQNREIDQQSTANHETNWKTYTNKLLRLSIEYPNSFSVNGENTYNPLISSKNQAFYVSFTANSYDGFLSEKTAEGWPGDYGRTLLYQKGVVIDNINSIEFAVEENNTKATTIYIYIPKEVSKNGKALTIEYPEGNEFGQILSTFKFLD